VRRAVELSCAVCFEKNFFLAVNEPVGSLWWYKNNGYFNMGMIIMGYSMPIDHA